MRNIFVLLVTCFCLFWSCKKKEPKSTPPLDNSVITDAADAIVFTDLEPDIVLNSISSMSLTDWGQFALPIDTSISVSVRPEENEGFSFVFSARNWFQKVSASTPGANYNFMLTVKAMLRYDSIGFSRCCDFSCDPLRTYSSCIGPGTIPFYKKEVALCSQNSPSGIYCRFDGDKYIAFKRTSGRYVYYGWIRVERVGSNAVKIKELAINKGSNRQILAGQKN